MSTGRTTDDRDLDSRRHRELKAVLDDVHRRVIRIERMLGPRPVTGGTEDPRTYDPERTELWPS